MAWRIIQQPDQKYLIFSTIVGNVMFYDLDRDELVEAYETRSAYTRANAEWEVDRVIRMLEDGKMPYAQFTETWEEMMETIRDIHGPEEEAKVRELTGKRVVR